MKGIEERELLSLYNKCGRKKEKILFFFIDSMGLVGLG